MTGQSLPLMPHPEASRACDVSLPAPMERKYCAFISYRHTDNREEGRRWAEWFHQLIEHYEVPRALVGRMNERGEKIPRSLYPVFRDEKELRADADLKGRIEAALGNSGFLIVLCSPEACKSEYVRGEIRSFKGQKDGISRILPVLLYGEPNASGDEAKVKAGMAECLPWELRFGALRADGSIDWDLPSPMPIAADVRLGGTAKQGYTSGNAYRDWLEDHEGMPTREARKQSAEYEGRLQQAKFKILAGLLGVSPGVLEDRDAAHRLRKARVQRRIATWVAIGAVALMCVAGVQWMEAKWQEKQAKQQEAAARSAEATAQQNGYYAAIPAAAASLERGHNVDAARLLDATAEHLKDFEWHYLRAQCDNSICTYEAAEPADEDDEDRNDPWIMALTWHADGKTATSIAQRKSINATLATWSTETGETLASLPISSTEEEKIDGADCSGESLRAVTTSKEGRVKLWNLAPLGLLKELPDKSECENPRFSPNGKVIFLEERGLGRIRVVDAVTGSYLPDLSGVFLESGGSYPKLPFIVRPADAPLASPDGRYVLIVSGRGFQVCEVGTGAEVQSLHRDGLQASAWRFSPDSRKLAVSYTVAQSSDSPEVAKSETLLYDLSLKKVSSLGKDTGDAHSVDISSDGGRIAMLRGKDEILLGDLSDETIDSTTLPPEWGQMVECQFSTDADSTALLATGRDRKLRVMNGRHLGHVTTLDTPRQARTTGFCVSPDGKRVMTKGDYSGEIVVWDLDLAPPERWVEANVSVWRGDLASPAVIFGWLANAAELMGRDSRLPTLRLHGEPIARKPINAEFPSSTRGLAAVSADGCLILRKGERKGFIELWRLDKAGMIHRRWERDMGQASDMTSLEVSPCGKHFAAGFANGIAVLGSIDDGAPMPGLEGLNPLEVGHTSTEPGVTFLAFSRDGKHLAAYRSDLKIWVWDAGTGACRDHFATRSYTSCLALDAAGGRVLYSKADSRLNEESCLIRTILDRKTIPLRVQNERIVTACFSEDGKRVVSRFRSGTNALWDPATGREILRFPGLGDKVEYMGFAPESGNLIAVTESGTIRILQASTAKERFQKRLMREKGK